MKACGDNQCPRKGEPLPLSDFYVDRRRKGGKGLYCKLCSRRHVKAYLQRKREQKAAQKAALEAGVAIQRKENVLAPIERVKNSVYRGMKTREEIHADTQLNIDDVCDLLAELTFDVQTIRIQRVEGQAYFVPRAA